MRIGMGGRGKAASHAGSSGRHEMTDSTPRTPLIGPDIEARAGGHEAQIMNTKSAREEAFLDTLVMDQQSPSQTHCPIEYTSFMITHDRNDSLRTLLCPF